MKLPFEGRKKMGAGEWIYRHRVGFLVTVIFHMSAAILFLTYQIIIKPVDTPSIAIEMVDEQFQPTPEQKIEEKKPVQTIKEVTPTNISNRISDRNAQSAARNLRDDRGTDMNKLNDEVARVQRDLAANKAAYEKGLAGIAAGGGRSTSDKTQTENAQAGRSGSDDKRQTVRSKGNVTVEYDLPGRVDVSLYIPAYQCENAGRVIVDITVDQRGRVINASVAATSTQDNCVTSMALQAARASTFNASIAAANRQKGTITYIFVAQ